MAHTSVSVTECVAVVVTVTLIGVVWPTNVHAADIRVGTLADVADAAFAADDSCGSGTVDDLPGADGLVSLREAIGAANHSPGPHRITFAPELANQTLTVSFDNLDADDIPNSLPYLCAGGVSIDGDTDGDGVPDVTIQNVVTADVSNNEIAGLTGVTITGGVGISGSDVGPAERNSVNAVVRNNHVSRAFAGIGVAGGASGVANDNTVEVTVANNSACRSVIVDIQCAGGFRGALGLPSNTGTGNMVSGDITANLADKIVVENGVAGNECTMTQQANAPCHAGDATCNGRVAAADVVQLLTLLFTEDRASCQLDDANADGVLDGNDIAPTIAAIFKAD